MPGVGAATTISARVHQVTGPVGLPVCRSNVTRTRRRRQQPSNRVKRDRAVQALRRRVILSVPCPVPVCQAPPGFFCSSRFRHYLHSARVELSEAKILKLGELTEIRRPLWRGGKRRTNPELGIVGGARSIREMKLAFEEHLVDLDFEARLPGLERLLREFGDAAVGEPHQAPILDPALAELVAALEAEDVAPPALPALPALPAPPARDRLGPDLGFEDL